MGSIPVTILGGSDLAPADLPPSGASLHPLATYKGVAIEVGGRPLIRLLVERLCAVAGFGPVVIAGPARVYGPLGLAAEIEDTDGTVGANLRAALDRHAGAGGDGPLAILACDVLPSVSDLDLLRRSYEASAPCALWFPIVPAPEDRARLGAFAWKPAYRLRPGPDAEPIHVFPGHLGILHPHMLRVPLLLKLIDAAYRTRNHSIAYRRAVMLRGTLAGLLGSDLAQLVRLRAPTRTWTISRSGLRLARELRAGRLERGELERLIARIFLRRDHAALPPERAVRLPVLAVPSLAEDVDTDEEAEEIRRRGSPRA